jgi:hypothetical protein
MNKLRKLCAIFIFFVASAVVLALSFFHYSITKGKPFIQPAFNRPVLNSYEPQTGDVLMVHYLGHGMVGIPVAEHWPTHTGMVWVQSNGKVVVIECTKFSAPALPNILVKTAKKERGVRVVPWDDYVNSVDNVLYIRQVIKGRISSSVVNKEVEEWAADIDFETRIADSMTFDLTIAIGFKPAWPKFSRWCATAAKLHEIKRREKQAFCSEFISKLLQRIGAIDPDYEEHYLMTPASFLKSVGELDRLAVKSPLGLQWGEDRMIVRRA